MATSFIYSPIYNSPYVLTSDARSISVTTDQTKLTVSLAYDGDVFFSVDLYAYNRKIELLDPGSIIEDRFRADHIVSGVVVISFGSVSKSLTFLYCEYAMLKGFNPEKSLLLSSSARRVHKGSKFTFAALPLSEAMIFDFNAVGLDSNGMPVTAYSRFAMLASKVPSNTYIFNVDNYLNDFIQDNPQITKVLYFSVNNDGRQLMCYLSPAPAWLTFSFKNIFNVQEYIDIEGEISVKAETSRQNAICAGDIVQYDRKTDRTYQLTTGPLPSDEIESIAQLISSHSVWLCVDNYDYEVIVTDHSFDVSTADNTLAVAKFTWRFKGKRPVIFNSPIFGIQKTNREIFSDEYSPEYE